MSESNSRASETSAPATVAAAGHILDPDEEIRWSSQPDAKEYAQVLRSHERWGRVLVLLPLTPASLAYLCLGLRARGAADPRGFVLTMLVGVALGLLPLAAVLRPVAWLMRARSLMYVVTNRRVLLLSTVRRSSLTWLMEVSPSFATGSCCGWEAGTPVIPNDPIARKSLDDMGVSVRTVRPIIGIVDCKSDRGDRLVLRHHDAPDGEGGWCSATTTLPGISSSDFLKALMRDVTAHNREPCSRGSFENAGSLCDCAARSA
jgi:hypothetical protein